MKRLLSIIMLIVCVLAKADAQYYSGECKLNCVKLQ